MSLRTFTVVHAETTTGHVKSIENLGGVYRSRTPVGAAKKATTKICGKSAVRGRCTLIVHVRETTRGSAKNVYAYKIRRIVNKTVVSRQGVEIPFKYTLVAKSIKQSTKSPPVDHKKGKGGLFNLGFLF